LILPGIIDKMAKQVIAIALGSRNTQAVLLEQISNHTAVLGYYALEAPRATADNAEIPTENYAELFRRIRHHFGGKVRHAVVALSYRDSLLGKFELPAHPPATLRSSLAVNPRAYLRNDYPAGHLFDCCAQKLHAANPEHKPASPDRPPATSGTGAPAKLEAPPAPTAGARGSRKASFLVGSAPRPLLDQLLKAAKSAGLRLELATPVQMAQIQALKSFHNAESNVAVANLDIGSEQSCISILLGGELAQSRVVNFGGNTLTRGLAEAMKVAQEAAESVKVILPLTVEAKINALLEPLALELKESIEYFEAHFEKKITLVYLSGGTARSPVICDVHRQPENSNPEKIHLDKPKASGGEPRSWLEKLEGSLQIPCQIWHLSETVELTMPVENQAVFRRDLPQLIGAIGVGAEWLGIVPPGVNVLATLIEEEKKRQRNPLRIGLACSTLLFSLLLIWSASLGWQLRQEHLALRNSLGELTRLNKRSAEVKMFMRMESLNRAKTRELIPAATNRFLAAPILDALQRCTVNDIVVTKITMERVVQAPNPDPAAKPATKRGAASRETLQISIKAKDYSELGATDRFIDTISANPFIKKRLPNAHAISLKDRSQRQVDTANPARSFALVTIDCTLTESSP
jgi:hypothetical protein